MKKILIVEDEKAIAKALALKLKGANYEVTVVGNGKDALKELEKGDYQLMLLDLVMPEMDGFEVLKKLEKDKNSIPVVVLSNLSQEEDAEKAKKLGAEDYFVKSDTPIVEVVGVVKKYI